MSVATAPRVLHVVPPGGGGVERCVRDIVRARPGDVIVHVCDGQRVLEFPSRCGQGRFVPLAPADLRRWALAGGFGAPLAMHAHSTVAAVRRLCEELFEATRAPRLLSLHDVWFADPALPAQERAERLAFVRAATRRVAPSRFIVEHAAAALGEDAPVQHLPLASAAFDPAAGAALALSPAAQSACGARGFALAVIGAIGAHKGLAALEALAPRLPANLRIVVIGYTERQLRQGWTADGRIWVHGIFHPDQLPRLAQLYGARLALFAPGMPESHCYALTDAWMSGLPVLAPDHGALAERVREHGGGALYAPGLDIDAWCALVVTHAAAARRQAGAIPLQKPLPTPEEMMSQLNALYDTLSADGPARPPDQAAVARLAQKHLDGHFFRLEVSNLQRELEHAWAANAELQQRLGEQENLAAQRLTELAAAQQQLGAQQAALRQALEQRDASHAAYLGLRGRLQRLVGWLPDTLRRALVALARRLRG